MDINYFDLVSAIIILLLGLKGILNGFFKEVFGLVGIVGGIFIASRLGNTVGEYLNNLIFNFSSPAAVKFLGFLTTLALFWLLMVIVGQLFKKLSALSGLGPVDRILGFVVGASKFFLIASVLAYSAYNIKPIRSSLDSMLENSLIFPIMVTTGDYIIQIDPVNMSEDLNKTIEKGTQAIKEKAQEQVNEQISEIQEEIEKKEN